MVIVMAALMAMPAMAAGELEVLVDEVGSRVEVKRAVAMVGFFSGGFLGLWDPLLLPVDLYVSTAMFECAGKTSSGYENYKKLE